MPFSKISGAPTITSAESIIPTNVNQIEEKSVQNHVSKCRMLWSIQCLVVSLFAILVLLTAISVWTPVFLSSIASIQDGSRRNSQLLNSLVDQYVAKLISSAPSAVDSIWEHLYWDNSLTLIENELRLRRVAHTSLQTYPSIASVFFGSPSGKISALIRSEPLPITHVWANGTSSAYTIDNRTCEPSRFLYKSAPIYAYNLIWYKAATAAKRTSWGTVQTSVTSPPQLIISVGRPVYRQEDVNYYNKTIREDPHQLGVVGVSFFLEQISRYLKNITMGKRGRCFIIERNGNMIASSVGTVTKLINNTIPGRVNGIEHEDDVIKSTVKELMNRYPRLSRLPETKQITFRTSLKEMTIVNFAEFKDPFGLDWLIIATQSYKELYGKMLNANIIAGCVSIFSLIFSVSLAMVLGMAITRPLTALSNQLVLLANMEIDGLDRSLSSLYEFSKMETALVRMKEGLNNFQKYVPGELVGYILRSGDSVELGVGYRELTVLFCDIAGFTNISESISPFILVEILQEFFTRANRAIAGTEGTVDKYIGDCVMAFWNCPRRIMDHEAKAVEAALDLASQLREMNQIWSRKGYPHIKTRTGINTARVLVGNVGAPTRMNFTALGDGVNIASRLEAINNNYKTSLIIGESTYRSDMVKQMFGCRWLDYVVLKGKENPVHIYEVINFETHLTQSEISSIQLHADMQMSLMEGDINRVKELAQCSDHHSARLLTRRLAESDTLYRTQTTK